MKKEIIEGNTKINEHLKDVVDKTMEVFYNPLMKFNRDTTILILNNYFNKPITASLPLSGSGVRGVRLLLNTPIEKLYFNDLNPKAIELCKKNIKLNKNIINKFQKKFDDNRKEENSKYSVDYQNKNANVFLRTNSKFDYVDIDPFGSSLPFIDSAISSTKRGGIIAITNTDTAALCGSYPTVTSRRYNSKPFNKAARQQIGLRILIKKVQLMGAIYDKALIPIFAFSKDHYMRVFFKISFSKEKCKEIISQHNYIEFDTNRFFKISDKCKGENIFGPIYTGPIYDKDLISKLNIEDLKFEISKNDIKFLNKIYNDSKLDSVFSFIDPHELCKMNSLNVPNYKPLFEKVEKEGFKILRSHYFKTAIVTNMPSKDFLKLLKKLVS